MDKATWVEATLDPTISEIKTPVMIKTNDIPLAQMQVNTDLHLYFAETRVLNQEPQIAKVLTNAETRLTWINIEKEKQMSYSKATTCLLIVNLGQGNILYNKEKTQAIKPGDIVIMPKDCDCEIQNTSSTNLTLLLVNTEDKYNQDFFSYQQLLAYNQERLEKMRKLPFLQFLQHPENITQQQAKVFLDCMQLFSSIFQRIIFIRQATCNDIFYENVFWEHFKEEFGHDKLLADRENNCIEADTILTGILSWFPYQMFLVDNVGKAALVHLVWEVMGDEAHTLAKSFQKYIHSNFYDVHEEHDAAHAQMGLALLKNQHPSCYKRLRDLLEESWDMFSAALERVMFLIHHKQD